MAPLLSYQLFEREAPTILFLHGFLGNSSQWDAIASTYKKSHQILLCELPGHGNNKIREEYTIDDLAISLTQILVQLDIRSVHFVGHSMGGYVGCAFAKAYPNQTASLHLINSCATGDTAIKKSQRDRSIKLILNYPDAFINMAINNLFALQEKTQFESVIENMKEKSRQISTVSIENALIAMRDRTSQLDGLKDLRIPIQYIHGAADEIIPISMIEDEVSRLGCNASVLNSGHMSLITHTEKIQNLLLI